MGKESTVDLKSLVAEASEIAKEVPEELRVAAFNRAFDALLVRSGGTPHNEPVGSQPRRAVASRSVTPSEAKGDRIAQIAHSLNRTEHPEIAESSTALDAALLVMKAVASQLGIEWLTPPEIARILREKFKNPYKPNAIQMALARAGKYVDRRTAGRSVEYSLMSPGERYLAARATGESPSGPRSGGQARPVRNRANSKADHLPEAKPAKAGARGSGRPTRGRPGPMALVDELIDNGYFDKPKTIGEVIEHASVTKGHRYKLTDLSPTLVRAVRSGRLSRDRNGEGQFHYARRR